MYLGLDVAQASVDLASEPAGIHGQFATDPAGLAALVAQCQAQPVTLVVLEATGGDDAAVVAALAAAGVPLAIVNPAQVRDTQPWGARQTDAIDAGPGPLRGTRAARPPLPDAATRATRCGCVGNYQC
jgi:transposase